MVNKNKIFDHLARIPESTTRERKRNVGLLEQRDSALSELTSGAIEDKVQRWVDPAICKMWGRHNRRYDLLTQSRCQDLIDGFRSQGKQEFPAIVRKINSDDGAEYEVICGARRHWTVSWLQANNYPEFKFLIEVRELTDEQAFRLSDIENRDKVDLSDYERAVDYNDALKRYYNNQKQMAARLEVSEAWLSRYLYLATLPQAIVKAFGDVTEIRVKHGRDLKPYLKLPRSKKQMLDAAIKISEQQAARNAEGKNIINGATVVKELIASTLTKKRTARGNLAEYKTKHGKPMLCVNRQGNSGLILRVMPKSRATQTDILNACKEALEKFL